MFFSLNSCVVSSYATTQDDIYTETEADVVRSNVSFDVIIQNGKIIKNEEIIKNKLGI